MQRIPIKDFHIGEDDPLVLISGPCVIEGEDHCLRAAEELQKICAREQIPLIFKSSYDKANRSAWNGARGPGREEGLRILEKVKQSFDLPILSDIHWPEEAAAAAQVCDVLQIPALLCRQTDLLIAAAKTGVPVNIKKGQFMSPWDMGNAVEKVRQAGNLNIILTDRGTSFGYNNLVSDMRGISVMQKFGVPVCFDATHSVQLPGGNGTSSGGQREFVEVLARAAVAAGANCLFMESHPYPPQALSDKDSVIDFKSLPALITVLKRLYEVVRHG